jgi:hypothetical protein
VEASDLAGRRPHDLEVLAPDRPGVVDHAALGDRDLALDQVPQLTAEAEAHLAVHRGRFAGQGRPGQEDVDGLAQVSGRQEQLESAPEWGDRGDDTRQVGQRHWSVVVVADGRLDEHAPVAADVGHQDSLAAPEQWLERRAAGLVGPHVHAPRKRQRLDVLQSYARVTGVVGGGIDL